MVEAMAIPGMGATLKTAHKIKTHVRAIKLAIPVDLLNHKILKMKKQTKKLTLNKKTISNLTAAEMGKLVGATSCGCYPSSRKYCAGTKNGNTCQGHKTCPGYYTC